MTESRFTLENVIISLSLVTGAEIQFVYTTKKEYSLTESPSILHVLDKARHHCLTAVKKSNIHADSEAGNCSSSEVRNQVSESPIESKFNNNITITGSESDFAAFLDSHAFDTLSLLHVDTERTFEFPSKVDLNGLANSHSASKAAAAGSSTQAGEPVAASDGDKIHNAKSEVKSRRMIVILYPSLTLIPMIRFTTMVPRENPDTVSLTCLTSISLFSATP